MKNTIYLIVFALCGSTMAFGQERTIKSEVVLENKSKSDQISAMFPKISVNDNTCRFEELAVRKSEEIQAEIHISFERPCDGHKSVSLIFSSLEEALLVKDLIIKNKDYTVFNVVSGKNQPAQFELRYK